MLITLLKRVINYTSCAAAYFLTMKSKTGSVSTILNFLLQKPGATTSHPIYCALNWAFMVFI